MAQEVGSAFETGETLANGSRYFHHTHRRKWENCAREDSLRAMRYWTLIMERNKLNERIVTARFHPMYCV